MVAESLQPGINVSELARRCGVNRGLLQTWRRAAMQEASDRGGFFVPLRIENTSPESHTEEPVSEPVDVVAPAGSGPASEPGDETSALTVSGEPRPFFYLGVECAACA